MRIAYATTFNARDVRHWSGTPFYMSNAFETADVSVNYIGSLAHKLPRFFKFKQIIKKYLAGQRESPRFNVTAAKHYSAQVANVLSSVSVDAVVAPLINPIAYLNCKQPIVLWTDALYASLVGFYAPFSTHSAETIQQGNAITRSCLQRAAKVIFSSQWAANSAVELYGVSPDKVAVVPFGANITHFPTTEEVGALVKRRSRKVIKLLFFAKSWERKGGPKVIDIAKSLHDKGHAVELTILGVMQDKLELPSFVRCTGYISKNTEAGKQQIHNLLSETHFLIVPSQAEAYGIVFCEANAFGIPCLTTHVGGIGTVIKEARNGIKYALDASVEQYCNDIIELMQDWECYEKLALSSYQEFRSRLNWQVAVNAVKEIIKTL